MALMLARRGLGELRAQVRRRQEPVLSMAAWQLSGCNVTCRACRGGCKPPQPSCERCEGLMSGTSRLRIQTKVLGSAPVSKGWPACRSGVVLAAPPFRRDQRGSAAAPCVQDNEVERD